MYKDLLDTPLFQFELANSFQLRTACEGIIALGGLGSGKTSAFGNLLAGNYLLQNFGFLVLSAKREKDLWIKYCKKYGREKDLVIFSPNSGEHFNFFEYMCRENNGKDISYNIADVLKNVIKAGSQSGQESDKEFWDSSLMDLLNKSVDLCLMTKNKRFEHIFEIIQSAPRHREQLLNEQWRQSSKCMRLMRHVAHHLKNRPKTPENDTLARRLKSIENFFLGSWLNLSSKTRSIVENMVFAFGSRYMQEPLYSLFNGKTTITPEDTIRGKIILIDLPVLVYDEIGRDCQLLWKYLWQRSMQKRIITPKSRPVCLWADEFQLFINPEKDVKFQSIAREYRACSVFITQNLPNCYLNFGSGEVGKTRFRALAGNLGTKFFLANTDVDTNEYAASLIGRDFKWNHNEGFSMGDHINYNAGQSEALHYKVDPSEFTKLKTGGPKNNYTVEAYVHRQGKIFQSTKDNYKKITLKQDTL